LRPAANVSTTDRQPLSRHSRSTPKAALA